MAQKPGAAQSLTREQILEEALAMADEIGIQNVSFRKLGAQLGKNPMTLYTYVSSIRDIREGVVALAFQEVDADPVPGERWDDTIRRTTASIRDIYLKHINADLFVVEEAADSAAFSAHTDRIFSLHRAQGIPADTLNNLWCMIDAFLGGFIPSEMKYLRSQEHSVSAEGHSWEPVVQAAYTEKTFAADVEIIIAGVKALRAPDPCDWHTPDA